MTKHSFPDMVDRNARTGEPFTVVSIIWSDCVSIDRIASYDRPITLFYSDDVTLETGKHRRVCEFHAQYGERFMGDDGYTLFSGAAAKPGKERFCSNEYCRPNYVEVVAVNVMARAMTPPVTSNP